MFLKSLTASYVILLVILLLLYVVASVVAVCVRSFIGRTNEYPATGGITVHNVGSMTFVAKGLITYTHTHTHTYCVQQHIHTSTTPYTYFKMDDFRVAVQ